jgi:transcriptional antiterminator
MLLNTNEITTIKDIASSLRISPKRVRYRLKKVSARLSQKNLTLQVETGKGLWIEGEYAQDMV